MAETVRKELSAKEKLSLTRLTLGVETKDGLMLFMKQLEPLVRQAQTSTGRDIFELSWDHHDNTWSAHLSYAHYNIRWNDIEQGWIGLFWKNTKPYEKVKLDPACQALADFLRENIDLVLVGWALRIEPFQYRQALVFESGKGWWGS
jgi:hypothetical protein